MLPDPNASASGTARSRLFWAGASLAVAVTAYAIFTYLRSTGVEPAPPTPAPAALAEFAEVRPARAPPAVYQTGFLRAAAEVELAFEVTGRIAAVAEGLEVGARVERGTVLIELTKARFRAELAAADAQRQQAEASLAQARSALERQRRLQRRDFASAANLEDAETTVARVAADLRLAEARQQQAQIALDDTTISAPFDAVVVAEQAAVGQLVQPGQTIGRLVRADKAELRVGLAAAQIALLGDLADTIGRSAVLFATESATAPVAESDAAAPQALRTARISAVEPTVDPASRTTNLVLTVLRPFDRIGSATPLRINQLLRAEIPVGLSREGLLTVPAGALKQGGQIWRLGPDNTLHDVAVQLVLRGDREIYLRSAELAAGDRVLLTDLDAPFDGQRVRPAPP